MISNRHYMVALIAGILAVFGFAPYYFWPIPIISLAVLFYLWQQATNQHQAFKLGISFGLGLYGFGIYWIYICLHQFGGMPWWFAGFCAFCLCGFMALFPGLVGYFAKRFGWLLLSAPLLWALSDWVRSWIFTGFPWLTLGYSQVPDSPMVGHLPMVGVYGVSLLAALLAALLAHSLLNRGSVKYWGRNLTLMLLLLISGLSLKQIDWVSPIGEPISVALVQGNIDQQVKWSPEYSQRTIELYSEMLQSTNAELVVLPETALPVLASQLQPAVIQRFVKHMQQFNGNAIVGLVQYNPELQQYLNSAISFGSNDSQIYSKNHLVPFGEFIPLKSLLGWIYRDWLNMPLSDLSPGGAYQRPMQLGNQKVAVNICYEDVFGEEVITQLPAATLMVNISNDAWYGKSFAADQHMQFSQARAIEAGRMMLRSTNTGATAIINTDGQVLAYAPQHQQTILDGEAQGYQGVTPYVRWGNWPFIIISFSALACLIMRSRKKLAH